MLGIQFAYITCCYVRQAFRLSRTTFVWKVCIKFEYVTEAVYCLESQYYFVFFVYFCNMFLYIVCSDFTDVIFYIYLYFVAGLGLFLNQYISLSVYQLFIN